MTHSHKPLRFRDEAEARRILIRALELEFARSETIDEARLHDIAAEAGIDSQMVQQALHETSLDFVPEDDERPSSRWWTPLLAGVTATILGAVARFVRGPFTYNGTHFESLGATVIISAGLFAAAWFPNRKHPQLVFQTISALAWTGFAAGWSAVHGYAWEDLVGVSAGLGAVSAVAGGLITAFRTAYYRRIGVSGGRTSSSFQMSTLTTPSAS